LPENFYAVPGDMIGDFAEEAIIFGIQDEAKDPDESTRPPKKYLHCEACTREHVAKRCQKCHEPIMGANDEGKARISGDRWWHHRCFQCNVCGDALPEGQKAFFHEGELWCEEHIQDHLRDQMGCAKGEMPSCQRCRETLSAGEEMIALKGRVWHQDCFCCSRCEQSISFEADGNIRAALQDDGGVVCPSCFEEMSKLAQEPPPSCRHCRKQIISGTMLNISSYYWHPECLVCEEESCGKVVDIAKAVMLPNLAEEFGVIFCSSACAAKAFIRSSASPKAAQRQQPIAAGSS